MKINLGLLFHWAGFLVSCFMLVASFYDASGDEHLIHFLASGFPLLGGWLLRLCLVGRVSLLPFIK